ncbi:MAG TPA: hypothetical protein VHJ77_14845 [Vicinamibacterales bacterium]|nr:hypothetical protein [Vicinamibacterales bacterium]
MDSVARARFGAVVEWAIAVAFLAATFAVGSLVLRELRAEPATTAAPLVSVVPASLPGSVPERAVSIQALPLADGAQIKIGETLSVVSARLGRAAESGRQDVDRGALGERLTRFYEYEGVRFILVFEPFERSGEPRVAAIYLT